MDSKGKEESRGRAGCRYSESCERSLLVFLFVLPSIPLLKTLDGLTVGAPQILMTLVIGTG